MIETSVSASHFRVHFKDIANSVVRGGQAFTVARHGLELVGLVSLEDIEFLRKHKWGQRDSGARREESTAASPPSEPETIRLTAPEQMPIELVLEAYQLTNGSLDFDIRAWRYRAYHSIRERTGKHPETRPFAASD